MTLNIFCLLINALILAVNFLKLVFTYYLNSMDCKKEEKAKMLVSFERDVSGSCSVLSK